MSYTDSTESSASETNVSARSHGLFSASFWRDQIMQPRGVWEVARLAAPLVVSSASFALMNFADRVYLARFDQRGMTAAFQAGCLLWALITFPTGIATFTNAFVAQYFGANERRKIGLIVWQGVFFGLATGLLYVAATPLVEKLFLALKAAPDLARMERNYWFFFSLGASAAIGHEPLTSYFSGQKDMKTVMWLGLAAVVLNAVLDPILIFGINGKLRLGVEGAAIASAIAMWFKFFAYLVVAFLRDRREDAGLRSNFRFDRHETKRLLRYGAMSGLQSTSENLCFTLFVLVMGWFGEGASAAAAIAFNLDCLAFVPIVGLGITATTLVGNDVGAKRFDLASRGAYVAAAIGVVITGFFMVAFCVAPNFFLNIYAGDSESFEEIRGLAVMALRFVSFYMFFDCLNVVFASALRGAGDAKFIMLTTIVVSGLTYVALLIGLGVFRFGLNWNWICLAFYVVLSSCAFVIRFARGAWKKGSLVEDAAIVAA